jgi:hypothetical protein
MPGQGAKSQGVQGDPMTVWIYDQGEDLKVFATEEIAQAWIDENDPDGVAFEYEVIGAPA